MASTSILILKERKNMNVTNIDEEEFENLVDKIEYIGYCVQSYSGRGMYGKVCLGVQIDHLPEIFSLGQALYEYEEMSYPSIDNLGLNYIVYWPDILWPKNRIG
mgnify:CR=1 FL=1